MKVKMLQATFVSSKGFFEVGKTYNVKDEWAKRWINRKIAVPVNEKEKVAEPDIIPVIEPVETEPKEPETEVSVAARDVDLDNYTVVMLRDLAKEKGLTGFYSMTKEELISALKEV